MVVSNVINDLIDFFFFSCEVNDLPSST